LRTENQIILFQILIFPPVFPRRAAPLFGNYIPKQPKSDQK